MPNLKVNENGSMGIEGKQLGSGGFVIVTGSWTASEVDKCLFTATRDYRLTSISARPETADSQAGTIVLRKAASGTVCSSGTALHDTSSPITLNGTAATVQSKTVLTSSNTNYIPMGTSVLMDITTAPTAGKGTVTVVLAPA